MNFGLPVHKISSSLSLMLSNSGNKFLSNVELIFLLFLRFRDIILVMNCRYSLTANEKVLWKLGNLKTFRPNVRRYKLLMFNYLQMIGQFPSAENKSTIKFPKFNHFRPPQLPQYYVGGRHFFVQ